MLIKVNKERKDLRNFRSYVIFGELYYREYTILIGLKIVYVSSKILLDYRVHNFGLVIGFGIKSNK
jgi:hypothetical protein